MFATGLRQVRRRPQPAVYPAGMARFLAAALAAVTLLTTAAAPPAQAATVVRASNAVVFFHDRWHPERTAVGSSAVFTREPRPVDVTITAQPSGRWVTFTAVVRNPSPDRRVRFPRRGFRVEAAVARNGRPQQPWRLRSTRRTLAPGATITLQARIALPRPGNYVVEAAARW
jgi:hypothetical protein